jgi:hypothetical protein
LARVGWEDIGWKSGDRGRTDVEIDAVKKIDLSIPLLRKPMESDVFAK